MLPNTKNGIDSRKRFLSTKSNVELSNQYSLKIVIESICWIENLPDNAITISFCNPIYQKFYTIPHIVNLIPNEHTYLENVQCRMNLEIPFDKVKNIFAHWSPTIIICDKDNTVLTQCSLDLNTFKLNRTKQRIFVRQSLYAQDNENEKLADTNIILTVYDDKISVTNECNANLGILFQISEQLENWKRVQKELYKKEEEERLNLLLEEWQIEKSKLQEKLIKNIQDTNNVLQEIKSERDILKARVETELNKLKVEAESKQKIDPPAKSNSNQKTITKKMIPINPTRIRVRETKELEELKSTIKNQTAEIKLMKQQYQDSAETFYNLYQTVDTLKTQIQIKDCETEYLKRQWAKTTRELNSFKKHYKNIEAKHIATHDSMLPLLIQQLLDSDAAEQRTDLQQLRSIEKELNRTKQVQITDITDLSEREILLQTNTYNNNDKIIQLLNRKK